MIDRIRFDEETGELTICFKASGRYVYSGVPRAIYDALKSAVSAGGYFNRCIKGRFTCRPDPDQKRYRPG